MADQLIISIGRQFGSGGHVIGEKLAEKYGFKLYDAAILEDVAAETGVDYETIKRYDEKRSWTELFSRNVRGFTTSMQDGVADAQFKFIRDLADSGESFVVVGRCAEHVLKGREALISFFILGDHEDKVRRTMELYSISSDEAEAMMKEIDYKRKSYHNYFSERKWGDSRGYDLTINSSRLGIDGTVELLEEYIRRRTGRG